MSIGEIVIIAIVVLALLYYLHSEKGKAQIAALKAELPAIEANVKAHVSDAVATVKADVASIKQHVTDEVAKVSGKSPGTGA